MYHLSPYRAIATGLTSNHRAIEMCKRFPDVRATGLDLTDWNAGNSYVHFRVRIYAPCLTIFYDLECCPEILRACNSFRHSASTRGELTPLIRFTKCDLAHGLPLEFTGRFDIIQCRAVLQHVRLNLTHFHYPDTDGTYRWPSLGNSLKTWPVVSNQARSSVET